MTIAKMQQAAEQMFDRRASGLVERSLNAASVPKRKQLIERGAALINQPAAGAKAHLQRLK